MPRTYLTMQETAEYLGVSRWTVARRAKEGAFGQTGFKGPETRIPVAAIAHFLNSSVVAEETPMTPDLDPETVALTGELPRLFTFNEVHVSTGIGLQELERGARANPPAFAHYHLANSGKRGQRRMSAKQVQDLLDGKHLIEMDVQQALKAKAMKMLARARNS